MPLTALNIPSQVPLPIGPYDATLAFCSAQTRTTTGYFDDENSGQLDIGGANPQSAAGRKEFYWVVQITALDFANADETYRLHLFGSNDVAFGNGNVEILQTQDFAAASAGRIVATIGGASNAVPPTNLGGLMNFFPATNLRARIVYRYLRMYLVVGGTSPSITATAWISFGDNKH